MSITNALTMLVVHQQLFLVCKSASRDKPDSVNMHWSLSLALQLGWHMTVSLPFKNLVFIVEVGFPLFSWKKPYYMCCCKGCTGFWALALAKIRRQNPAVFLNLAKIRLRRNICRSRSFGRIRKTVRNAVFISNNKLLTKSFIMRSCQMQH